MLLPIIIATVGLIGPPANVKYQPTAAKQNERLSAILKEWQAAEGGVRDVRKVLRRTIDDKTWRSKETALIEITAQKPDLWRIEVKDAKKNSLQLLVCTGRTYHYFNFSKHEERKYEVPLDYPDIWTDNKLFATFVAREILTPIRWISVGFDVEELQKNYASNLDGEDADYAYVSFRLRKGSEPVLKSGRFPLFLAIEKLQVALLKKDYLPHSIRLYEANGNLTTWDTLKLETNFTPPVTTESIEADLPRGWTKANWPSGS